jgi:hypothetical protein
MPQGPPSIKNWLYNFIQQSRGLPKPTEEEQFDWAGRPEPTLLDKTGNSIEDFIRGAVNPLHAIESDENLENTSLARKLGSLGGASLGVGTLPLNMRKLAATHFADKVIPDHVANWAIDIGNRKASKLGEAIVDAFMLGPNKTKAGLLGRKIVTARSGRAAMGPYVNQTPGTYNRARTLNWQTPEAYRDFNNFIRRQNEGLVSLGRADNPDYFYYPLQLHVNPHILGDMNKVDTIKSMGHESWHGLGQSTRNPSRNVEPLYDTMQNRFGYSLTPHEIASESAGRVRGNRFLKKNPHEPPMGPTPNVPTDIELHRPAIEYATRNYNADSPYEMEMIKNILLKRRGSTSQQFNEFYKALGETDVRRALGVNQDVIRRFKEYLRAYLINP